MKTRTSPGVTYTSSYQKNSDTVLGCVLRSVPGIALHWLRLLPWCLCALATVVWLLALTPAQAQAQAQAPKRVALLIGNAAYSHERPLKNPLNDAELLGRVLKDDLKFDDVRVERNLSVIAMDQAVDAFVRRAQGADAIFFYYSGHGQKSADRRNFLLPTDARTGFDNAPALDRQAVSAESIRDRLKALGARVTLVILDACRDGPGGGKSGNKGLARMGGSNGLLVAYATEEDRVAADGTGNNSPYAQALAKALKRTDLPVLAQFDLVADEVSKVAPGQEPTRDGNLRVNAYLVGSVRVERNPTEIEQQAWDAAQRSSSEPAYRAYLAEYPQGRFAVAAREAIDAIQKAGIRPEIANTAVQPFVASGKRLSVHIIADSNLKLRGDIFAQNEKSGVTAITNRNGKSDSPTEPRVLIYGDLNPTRTLDLGSNSKEKLDFNSDGNLLLINEYGGSCFIVESKTGSTVKEINHIKEDKGNCRWIGEIPNNILVRNSRSKKLEILDIQTGGSKILQNSANLNFAGKTSNGMSIFKKYLPGSTSGFEIYYSENYKQFNPIFVAKGSWGIDWNDRNLLVQIDSKYHIINIKNQKIEKIFSPEEVDGVAHKPIEYNYPRLSVDGKKLITTVKVTSNEYRSNTRLQIWDLESGKLAKTLVNYISGFSPVVDAFSPNGRFYVYNAGYDRAGNDPKIGVLDLQTLNDSQVSGSLGRNIVFLQTESIFNSGGIAYKIDY